MKDRKEGILLSFVKTGNTKGPNRITRIVWVPLEDHLFSATNSSLFTSTGGLGYIIT